jgi:hypothetical protein
MLMVSWLIWLLARGGDGRGLGHGASWGIEAPVDAHYMPSGPTYWLAHEGSAPRLRFLRGSEFVRMLRAASAVEAESASD